MIKVLYVDDDESFCGFFKIYLEKNEDIIVTTVQSGLAALEMVLSGSHDIVISDYSMPGMSGMDLLRAMRREGVQIPFILFTGKGREEVVIEAINEGATFICKKVVIRDLFLLNWLIRYGRRLQEKTPERLCWKVKRSLGDCLRPHLMASFFFPTS